ncbi:hypothetical protein A1507_07105 [Methylomonas koyamae]|uniref:Uncharacterized protein n=1 Tax=Methylomonas koyamae TaxID=702114 RepID=A0A177NNA4_9GAMM|nr:hypothetical protein [Methylomonas koyamae]OAI19322.1 hypothetical protein A1507_07105 [Methylomonas koyamae]
MKKTPNHAATTKSSDAKAVGLIGTILISIIQPITFPDIFSSVKQGIVSAIPIFSIWIANTVIWIWGYCKPENIDGIRVRRALDKKEKEIKRRLNDPDLSEDAKQKLQKLYDEIVIKRINTFDHL